MILGTIIYFGINVVNDKAEPLDALLSLNITDPSGLQTEYRFVATVPNEAVFCYPITLKEGTYEITTILYEEETMMELDRRTVYFKAEAPPPPPPAPQAAITKMDALLPDGSWASAMDQTLKLQVGVDSSVAVSWQNTGEVKVEGTVSAKLTLPSGGELGLTTSAPQPIIVAPGDRTPDIQFPFAVDEEAPVDTEAHYQFALALNGQGIE